ncbi:DUF541 domain-containing protein [Candidatus Pacearchaeota archaeon]|nr:DUF541 domain-containing protein [Candidatus Pacearchaeota archaeon]
MDRSLKITIAVIVGVILFAGIILITNPENQENRPTINVRGEASIDALPDIIKVHLTMRSNTTEEKSNDRYIEELTSKFVSKGFRADEIQIQNLNIVPFTYYPENYPDSQSSDMYRITSNLIAKFPSSEIEKIGRALSVGVENGATSIQVSYELSKDKENEYKAESIEKASKDARNKAESLAEGLNKRLGKLVSVSSDQFNYVPKPGYNRDFSGGNAAEDIAVAKSEVAKIQVSEQKITSTVNAVFELR